MKYFDIEYFGSLSAADKEDLLLCVNSGLENADSGVGCYARNPGDYEKFRPFFSKVLAEYHNVGEDAKHVTNWSIDSADLPEGVEGGKLDIAALGLPALSTRVRVGRNLSSYPLPGAMTKEQRISMEKDMCVAFDKLIAMPAYGGRYCSLTEGHPNFVDATAYQDLVERHIMFKDMGSDPYLVSAGLASSWPHGRGCYISADEGFIIWVGEEDHLRLMCMAKSSVLNDVFDRLEQALEVVNAMEGLDFAASADYGNVTSCPTNLGTAMRASVLLPIPSLCRDALTRTPRPSVSPWVCLSEAWAGSTRLLGWMARATLVPRRAFASQKETSSRPCTRGFSCSRRRRKRLLLLLHRW
jgi:creatine kinase